MILTVIHDQETDLTIAGVVATVLLKAGLNEAFQTRNTRMTRQNWLHIGKRAPTGAAFKYRVLFPMVRL